MWIWPLAVALLALVVAGVAITQIKRNAREDKEQEQRLAQRIEKLESELSAMMDGAFGVASHLQKVETNLKSTAQLQEQMQQRDMGNLPYNEAVRLASKGADVSELVEHCGLSRSEAELVEMLHKKSLPTVADEEKVPVPQVTDVTETEVDVADSVATEQPAPQAEQHADFSLQAEFEPQLEESPQFEEEPQQDEKPQSESATQPEPDSQRESEQLLPTQEPHSQEISAELIADEDDDLPTADMGSDEFQQALEQARAFQQHSSESDVDMEAEQQAPDLAVPSGEPVWPELENEPSQENEPDDKR